MGGAVHPINAAVDCSHGIGTWDWPEVDSEVDWERSLKYTVPMTYIESLFQMETWQREYNLDNWKTFHIPRDGATSVNMNNLTTMPWSEEIRVAREELEESLNAANQDEPAARKREIGTGQAVISSPRFEEELESTETSAKAPPLVQTIKQQERTIKLPTTMSRKQLRNQKKAERKATDDKSAVPKRGDAQVLKHRAEVVKVAVDPENPTKQNGKGKEKAVEEGVIVEKNRTKLHVSEETEAAVVPGKQTSIAGIQLFPAKEHPVISKEQSSAEEPTLTTAILTISKQASPAEISIAIAPDAMLETPSPAEERAIMSTELPVLAEAQPAVISKKPILPTATLDAKKI